MNWYSNRHYFGLHYDLHAGKGDTELGTRCGGAELVPMLRSMAPDFVQTDCRGMSVIWWVWQSVGVGFAAATETESDRQQWNHP